MVDQNFPARDPRSVTDEASFLTFVRALSAEAGTSASPQSRWENTTLADFFEAAVAWADDSQFGKTQNSWTSESPWQRFAVFLHVGTMYE